MSWKRVRDQVHLVAVCVVWCAMADVTFAQDSSLYLRGPVVDPRLPLTLENGAFLYRKPEPIPELKLHDIVTVVVNLNSRVLSDGEVESRKRANLDAVLSDWIVFKGLSVRPDPQSDGDPRIAGQLNSQFRAESELELRNALTFTIAAEVIDVRPNGTMVVEGRQTARNNEEVWELSLTGIIRREDVTPDNKVLSEDVAQLQVFKREVGHVRDGYRRGWFQRFYDFIQPF